MVLHQSFSMAQFVASSFIRFSFDAIESVAGMLLYKMFEQKNFSFHMQSKDEGCKKSRI